VASASHFLEYKMNNRIKELMVKAEIKFESHPQHQGVDTAVIIPTDFEKFAELIVKECARAIINDSRLNDVRSAANGCVRTINEHFGVE
jgi:hypothetical protein